MIAPVKRKVRTTTTVGPVKRLNGSSSSVGSAPSTPWYDSGTIRV